MRKYNVDLMEAMLKCENKKCGNHKLTVKECIFKNSFHGVFEFSYHGNVILAINNLDDTVTIDDCNYTTTSTTQAINGYIECIHNGYLNYNEYTFIDNSSNKRFTNTLKKLFINVK